jgi:amino acid permease
MIFFSSSFFAAFSITVPAWLNEKHPEVSANKVIWCSTTLTTVIYLSFGLCASMAFSHTNEDVLTILASKQVIISNMFEFVIIYSKSKR